MGKKYIKYAKICAMSYEGKYGKYDLSFEPTWYKVKNTDWFVGEDEENVYICIQGSRANKDKKGLISEDWKSNFKFRQESIKWKFIGKVHKGHYEQALRIFFHSNTSNMITKTVKNVIMCGHSAGGSIAEILSLMFAYCGVKKIKVFTEGQNRCFNKTAQKWFDKNVESVRIVNSNDPVPCVPFKCFGYKHTKNVINVGKKRKWWQVIVLFGRWKKNLVDHSPKDYVENLEKYYAEKNTNPSL